MILEARAKINLYLEVSGLRSDGFHDIRSIMHEVSLSDLVTCCRLPHSGREISLSVDRSEVPTGNENIVWRAAEAFFADFNIDEYAVEFHIEKHIPMAAGLAGGSSDAAAAILMLDRLFDTHAGYEKLCRIGARVGSDVPFCIVGGTCEVSGRGVTLRRIETPMCLNIVIAKGGEGISTREAYGRLDDRFGDGFPSDDARFGAALTAVGDSAVNSVASLMYNSFEEVIFPVHPEAAHAKELLLSFGARAAMLSGSGPSVFGIFDSEADARVAADRMRLTGYDAFACRSYHRQDLPSTESTGT